MDARSGSGMTRRKVRCPIGVGHDGNMKGMTGKGTCRRYYRLPSSLPGAIVIAGLTGNLRCSIVVGHDEEKSEMPDRGRA